MINDKLSMINSRGFTLIELLVAVAIISILFGISFLGYRAKGEELNLQRAALKISADIEKIREMAMSADELSGVVPEGGYGVHFDIALPDQYIIFADLGPSPDKVYSGSSEEVEVISLGKAIKIKSVSPPSPSNVLNIVFVPPAPNVYLQGGAIVDQARVVISLADDPSKTKTISVNKVGLISISD